jgi:hypothetical protein
MEEGGGSTITGATIIIQNHGLILPSQAFSISQLNINQQPKENA